MTGAKYVEAYAGVEDKNGVKVKVSGVLRKTLYIILH